MLSVCGVLLFRWKRPDMPRPIKVNIAIPITFVIICIFLIIVPTYQVPAEAGMGCLITLAGIPFYMAGVAWKNKPKSFQDKIDRFTISMQKLFMSAKEEADME
jgi:solute carrier family 7 (L-type amino acid transporter), member 5